jgi:Ca2+-binding EF-hand superfamily protein
MLNEASGPINFTMFLTLFGSKMCGTDSEDVLRNAFSCFDEKGTGYIPEENFREMLSTIGDRYTQDEVDELMSDVPIRNGMINYYELAHLLKNGKSTSEHKTNQK